MPAIARRPRALATAVALAAALPVVAAQPAQAARLDVVTTTTLAAVDAGGLVAHGEYTADNGHTGGLAAESAFPAAVAGEPSPDVMYSVRYGADFTYQVRGLEPGAHVTVRLNFMEDYFDAAGQRIFDVYANGDKVVSDLDVFAAAGGKLRPMHRDVPAVVDANGRLVLHFVGTKGDAVVQAFTVTGQAPDTRFGSYLQLKDLKAVATSATTTHVSWAPVAGVKQYVVLRDGKEVGRTSEYAFIDTTAVPGRHYRYSAAAIDRDGSYGLIQAPIRLTMPSGTPQATGAFHTEGSQIIDPKGKPFVPVGVNLGTQGILDWAGSARGHAVEAKQWGWNTVRLVVRPEGWDDADLRATVDEYRKAGLVVILDAHLTFDSWDPQAAQKRAAVTSMWQTLAPRYKSDSGVWFNLINEPGSINDEWLDDEDSFARTVRSSGAQNIMVVDAPTWGQDLGSHLPWHAGARFAYSPTQAPLVSARYGNVVLGQHNYGAFAQYDSPEKYSAYIDAVHHAALPLVASEFGYAYNGSTTAGGFPENHRGGLAVFGAAPAKGVGIIPWNGNGGDAYSLKDDGTAFWNHGAGAQLSELGTNLWSLTH